MAEQEGVDIRKYSVIYDAIEEVKAAMEGMLAPTLKEQITATIEVREVFNITKVGLVAGAMVKTGKVKRSDKARLIRDGIVIFTGAINALKRFKDDVKEVGTNFEWYQPDKLQRHQGGRYYRILRRNRSEANIIIE